MIEKTKGGTFFMESKVGPRYRGNAYKGEPDIKAKLLRPKKESEFFNAKKFQYKGRYYKGHFDMKVKVFDSKRVFSKL